MSGVHADAHKKVRVCQSELWLEEALVVAALMLGMTPVAAVSPPAEIPVTQQAVVDFHNGGLSVSFYHETWGTVLNKVTDRTGIPIHINTPLEGTVTTSFSELPLRQAFEHLFGPDANLIFQYPKDDRVQPNSDLVPTAVWVLGKQRIKHADSASLGEERESNPADRPLGQTQDGDTVPVDELIEMTRSDLPSVRIQGLKELTVSEQADETKFREALDTALADQDPGVRAQAVEIVAGRGGDQAMQYLWQALRDPDPAVRMMAVQSVEPKDQGLALLQEALSDTDESVRAMASLSLQQDTQEP